MGRFTSTWAGSTDGAASTVFIPASTSPSSSWPRHCCPHRGDGELPDDGPGQQIANKLTAGAGRSGGRVRWRWAGRGRAAEAGGAPQSQGGHFGRDVVYREHSGKTIPAQGTAWPGITLVGTAGQNLPAG